MGSIISRKRSGGSLGHTARIRLKRGGKVVHDEAKTFDKKQAAVGWMRQREAFLSRPNSLSQLLRPDPPLAAVIDQYIAESGKPIGRTKAQVLSAIKKAHLAELPCSKITSVEIVSFAQGLNVQPQTVGNYLSHLASIFSTARPAWGYPLDQQAMRDTFAVAKRLHLTSNSIQRDRRPTLEELDKLMTFFGERQERRPDSAPMQLIIAFAIFSTRRQEEITRLKFSDYEPDHHRILVRDMKNPGQKIGNNIWCDLTPEAERIISVAPTVQGNDRVFPYGTDAISSAFTRACQLLGIKDLHFHDLRHEGVSRLFEMGETIPHVAGHSGHRSWSSLKRYTQLRQRGDKFAGWWWLATLSKQIDSP